MSSVLQSVPAPLTSTPDLSRQRQRLISLDAFRGLTIAAMILVNDPGSWNAVYPPLLHAEWNGWTPTDLVFPFFLFIMGVAMEFSFSSRKPAAGDGPWHSKPVILHVLYRSAIIFALGLFLHMFPFYPWHRVRIMGVLQRIAVCYLVAGIITLKTGLRARTAIVGILLFGYWALMTLVPVPGYGAGHLDQDGNLAAYIDRTVMAGHTWKPTWDPEGLLSTLPAIATTLLGGFVGHWLRSSASGLRKIQGLLIAGVAGLALGELWNLWFPINKNIWSSSYVLFTAGFACVLLALFYWLIEIKQWRRWAQPLVVFGKNAIAAFVLSILLAKLLLIGKVTAGEKRISRWTYLYQHLFLPLANPRFSSLLFALTFVLVCWIVMLVFYRRNIFFKI